MRAPDPKSEHRAVASAETVSDTLPHGFETGESSPRFVDVARGKGESFDPTARYEARRTLGEGGMGEVRLCADAFVGREVAMKVIRASHGHADEVRARFLREARVQGQLEHPSIVPVYDIGVGGSGDVFFTMKRIVGKTLEEILAGLGAGDPEMVTEFPRRRVLSAVAQVCLALAFAHTKGVVHRDLKPANIMLGDFGEVYVLDWGIAKVPSETGRDPPDGLPIHDDSRIIEAHPSSGPPAGATREGVLLGTPGYMSPEQARGEASACDARSDVYALGAVLYEVVSGVPMIRVRNLGELLVATAMLDGAHPLDVAPGVPPELDAICSRATRAAPADRFASAREMHDALERFLDGERDLERRLTIADQHAQRALDLMTERVDPETREERRAEAMREVGAALALHPAHPLARKTIVDLLLDEPDALPAGAVAELAEVNRRDRAKGTLGAAYSYLSWMLVVPLLLWMGIRSAGPMIGLAIAVLTLTGYLLFLGRTKNTDKRYMRVAIGLNFLVVAMLSTFFGPLVLVPQSVVAVAASLMVSLRANFITRLGIAAFGVLAVFVPLVLGWAGVVPDPYTFENGTIVIHPVGLDFPPVPTLLLLLASTAFATLTSAKLIGEAVEALIVSERRTVARAFRLRQLLPIEDASSQAPG